MAETTTPRLMAAAKEFNVGKDTLVDFLLGKGFSKDDLNPSSKLSEDMYRSLQQEFQSDKVAKSKSDQIDLPKGSTVEAKKKKEDETIVFRKDPKRIIKEEPVPEAPRLQPVEEKKKEPELVKMEAPEIEGPKVLDKIDLSSIDSSTRPKKAAKKKTPEPEEKPSEPEIHEAARPEADLGSEVVIAQPDAQDVNEVPQEAEENALIENIKADKIEGPKILGKIDLSATADSRPKPTEEKRKRKRIPIEKKRYGQACQGWSRSKG